MGITIKVLQTKEEDRLAYTPVDGELVYVTDRERFYMGDGKTLGGVRALRPTYYTTFNHEGDLEVLSSPRRWFSPSFCIITNIEVYLGMMPVGSDVGLVIRKNGEVMTSLTIKDGTTNLMVSDAAFELNKYDSLTVDIVAVGSTVTGTDLTLRLTYR
jgi:hypothetical protein